ILTEHEVLSINPVQKTVTVRNNKTNEMFEDNYDKLVIATGATSKVPDIKGADRSNVFLLRNINDMKRIKNFIEKEAPKKAVVIGSGFIGMEMCEAFKNLGIDVTIVARSSLSKGIDKDMSVFIEKHLKEKGISIFTNTPTTEITD